MPLLASRKQALLKNEGRCGQENVLEKISDIVIN